MTQPSTIQRFFAELKRRQVFRVMAVYGIVGFVILQVVDLAVPALLLPEWTYRFVALLLLIGFPVAIVLAWAFERTPQGVQRTQPASAGEIQNAMAQPAAQRWPMGLAALGGAGLLALGAWWVLGDSNPAEARDYDSIAVLPFVNMTGDAEAEYLGDGLAEELLNALSSIEALKVASRTSAFAFKESTASAQTIGDSLGVGLVLEGSVRGTRDRVRVTAQLIDSEDGFHLWSQTYDRALTNLLELQDDLTRRIVDELAVQLAPEDSEELLSQGTDSEAAFDYFLQGRHFWNKRTPEDMRVAIGLFERAIAADSSYAPAYASIADVYAVPTGWDNDPGFGLGESARYAERALELDPTLAQAHSALAYVLMVRDLDFEASDAEYVRALELDPNYATGHQWYADLLSGMDRHDEAIASALRAEEIDPTMIIRWNVARALFHAGRYGEAAERARAVAAEGGSYSRSAHWIEFDALVELNDYEALAQLDDSWMGESWPADWKDSVAILSAESAAAARRYLARTLDSTIPPETPRTALVIAAAAYWAGVDSGAALDRLEALVDHPDRAWARTEWFWMLQDPRFDELRDHPRFVELDARIRE